MLIITMCHRGIREPIINTIDEKEALTSWRKEGSSWYKEGRWSLNREERDQQ